MEREEFLQKIFTLYPNSFNKGNGTHWLEAYKSVLGGDIDYEKLYNFTISNYAGACAPSPAYLLKNAVYKQKFENNKSIVYDTIIAKKNNSEYEFALEDSYLETKKRLLDRGFNNIRLKFQ